MKLRRVAIGGAAVLCAVVSLSAAAVRAGDTPWRFDGLGGPFRYYEEPRTTTDYVLMPKYAYASQAFYPASTTVAQWLVVPPPCGCGTGCDAVVPVYRTGF
ncbi:MAG: hypothetical protein H7831_02315 [Magnetococcus sp. WYHC-3]